MPSWKKLLVHGGSGSLAHLKLENLTSQNVLGTDAQGNIVAGSVSGYTLPVATDSILGGIKVGGTLIISNGVLSARTYVGAIAAVPGEGSGVAGVAGYVPSATAGQATYFLRGDGTWAVPTNTVTRLRSSAGTNYLSGDLMITGSGATSVSVAGSTFTISTAAPTPYSLPIATASTLGGIKIGSGLTIDRETGVVTAAAGTSLSADRTNFYTGSISLTGAGATTVSYVPQLGGFVISSTDTDTDTWRPLGTGADDAAAGNHLHDDRYLRLSDTGSFFDRIIDSAPGTLDTLNELAAAIGDDANFSASIAGVLARKSEIGHNHDDRYYTETEVNTLLAGKAAATHSHDYDNYGYWEVADRTTSTRLESTNTLTILGDGATTVSLNTETNTLTISSTDTDTTYAQATSSTLGLVKIGYTANAKNYPVALDGTGKMYVNVPWTDTDTDTITKVGVPDDLSSGDIEFRGGGATTITKSGNTITISSTDTDTNTTYSAGTGLTLSGTTFSVTAGTYAAANHNHDDRYFTETESDSRFLKLAGGTMTGTLTAPVITPTLFHYAYGWRKYFQVRSVGVSGGSINNKWVHLFSIEIAGSYDKALVKAHINGYDDVSIGTEVIHAVYENGASAQENHDMYWYSIDNTASLFKAVKSIRTAASGLRNSYEVWVQMAGDWKDTFTMEVEFWEEENRALTFSTAAGQVEEPSGDDNDIVKTSRQWTVNSNLYIGGNIALGGTVDGRDIAADGTKLDGIASGANNYSLPLATSSVRGGVKIGYTANGKNYPVQLSSEQMYVNVPWTDTDTDTITKVGVPDDLSSGDIELRGGGATTITKSGGTITITSTDTNTDTVTSVGVTGNLSTGNIILAGGGGTSISKSGGTITISSTDTNTTYSAGTGLTLSGTTFSVTADTYAAATHGHTIRDVEGLEDALNGKLSTSGTAASATSVVTLQDSAPTGTAGKLWWESDTGILKVYYGSAWVDAVPMPDLALYYSKAGGAITGDVSIGQTLTVTGNTTIGGNIAVAGTVDGRDLATDGAKLDGIAAGANNYSLPTATASVLGGIKVGTNLSITNGVLSSTDTITKVGVPDDLSSGDIEFRGDGATTITKSGGTITISSTDNDTTYSNATTSVAGLMSSTDKTKLDGIASGANNYSLPLATASVRGGVKIGYTANGKNYPVQLSSEQMYVNVPWTDTNTDTVTKVGVPDDLSTGDIEFRGGGATTITKSGGTITITSTDTDTNTTYSAGTNLSLSGTTFNVSSTPSFSSVTATHTTFGRTFTWYGGNLAHTSTTTGTSYRVMRVYYNQGHWGGYGTTRIKIYATQYRGGYQEWVLKNYTGGVYLQLNDYGISPSHSGTVVTLGDPVRVGTYSGLDTYYRDVYMWFGPYFQATYQLEVDGNYGIDADGDTNNYTKFVIWSGGNRTSANGSMPATPSTTYHSVNYAASAGSVAWTDVSGRPTAVSSFTNDAGYLTSYTDTNTITSVGIADDLSTGNIVLKGGGATTITKSGGTITISSTDSDTTYSTATSSTLGLVKIGYTANGKNYPVQLSSGQMYVNVPWTDTDTNTITKVGVPDDLSTGDIEFRGGGATSISKSGGTITITSTDNNTTYSAGTGLTLSGTTFSVTAGTYAAASHTHTIANVTGLQTALDGKLSTSGTAAAATSVVTIQDSAPTGAAGKLWWESDTGKLKVYYGSAWIDASPIPDMSLYYSRAGGTITGDVTVQQTLTVVGNVLVEGRITETSDITLKENIVSIENSLDKVLQLRGVSFNKKTTPEAKEIGFIAQEVEEVIPELVTETEDGIKTVSYSRVTAVLVETIKEQQSQINELKELVLKLTEKVNTL